MIAISFDEKVKIGLQYALETLHGCSPFGLERIRRLRFYTPDERPAQMCIRDSWYTDNTYGVLPALCCVP